MTHPLILRRSTLRATTLDRDARTVEAVFSTGASVERKDAHGPFTEQLDLAALDTGRLIGMPVLDAHRQGSIRDALGSVEDARFENGELVGTVRIARGQEGDAALDLIEDGALRGVSIGYRAVKTSEHRKNGVRIRTISPEIVELSLVPVPADPGATIRSQAVENGDIQTLDRTDSTQEAQQTRADANREIRSIANLAGLNRDWADTQIDSGATVETARAAAFDAMRQRPQQSVRAQVGTTHDATPEQYVERRGEALFARANPSHNLSDQARQYAGNSMLDIARDCLRRGGQPITGLAGPELATRALHSTSDFPLILGDAVSRALRQAYGAAPSGLKRVARQSTARDFRANHSVQLGEAPQLEKVKENGEFTRGTLAEARETYRLDTYGRIIGVSRQAIVNDDLGAFSNLSGRIGSAAAAFEASHLVKLIESNPVMADDKRLFSNDHANKAEDPSGDALETALGETTLSAARHSMRKQTGLSDDLINVTPRFVIVPPAMETHAEKILSSVQASRTEDVNPFDKLELIVEPRLNDSLTWYLAADPATIDGLEYSYLEGAPGPQIETRNGFDIDGVEFKVRLDFGAGFLDWRGFYAYDGGAVLAS